MLLKNGNAQALSELAQTTAVMAARLIVAQAHLDALYGRNSLVSQACLEARRHLDLTSQILAADYGVGAHVDSTASVLQAAQLELATGAEDDRLTLRQHAVLASWSTEYRCADTLLRASNSVRKSSRLHRHLDHRNQAGDLTLRSELDNIHIADFAKADKSLPLIHFCNREQIEAFLASLVEAA